MKVIVTGATGNAGTSVVAALGEAAEIERIVGLARRRPGWSPPKTEWVEGDVVTADLRGAFDGADAVIHLAWAIQPSHDQRTLERVNVDGSRRVFEAAAAAGVGKIVYASSVGAYSPGPREHGVEESWPVGGIETSSYSRHKAAVEAILDDFEGSHPDISVVRLRPALIFKGSVGTEIRRLFAGPFMPTSILRRRLLPLLPQPAGLRFQAVHSHDVGQAYLLAVTGDMRGAFNIAAEPDLDGEALARLLGARRVSVPSGALRRLADLSWRLRLQPTSPGWLDMAMEVPMMSTERARNELGWEPRHSATEALAELLEGMGRQRDFPTPPLETHARLEEVTSGVGGSEPGRDRDEQLVKHLTDMHSVEEQALVQMRAAPQIAGKRRLAEVFERHLVETEEQERRVRERVEAHGAGPSKLKDAAGALGGEAMLVFARSQPDTPGKLVAHAYSYEHMELAGYELLRRLAERTGDEETAAAASEIAGQEKAMGDRLEGLFEAAADASLEASGDSPADALGGYLRDAHAIESQSLSLLEKAVDAVDDSALARVLAEHLEETRAQAEALEGLLRDRGEDTSSAKDALLGLGGVNLDAFFSVQPDTTTKLAAFSYAFEHLEIASYSLLQTVAERAGDELVARVAEQTIAQERAAAEAIAGTWDRPGVPLGSAS